MRTGFGITFTGKSYGGHDAEFLPPVRVDVPQLNNGLPISYTRAQCICSVHALLPFSFPFTFLPDYDA
jgi:hypothetical protein